MIKPLLISFLLTFSFNQMEAQHVRTGSFVANTPSVYPISGDIEVSYENGMITVFFLSNFSTVQGFNLEVFLTKNKILNSGTDLLISSSPLGAGISMGDPINGPLTFNVPPGTDPYEYNNVIVECTLAGVLWGHANLCETNLAITNNPVESAMYHAISTIDCNATLDGAANISFETQDEVTLTSGFCAPSSTELTIELDPSFGCVIE